MLKVVWSLKERSVAFFYHSLLVVVELEPFDRLLHFAIELSLIVFFRYARHKCVHIYTEFLRSLA